MNGGKAYYRIAVVSIRSANLNTGVKSAFQTGMNPPRTFLNYKLVSAVVALTSLFIPRSFAENESISAPQSAQALAFARYVSSIQQRDPFTESGPVMVEIEASLPALYKQARLLAVRGRGESEKPEYELLAWEGDAIMMQEVVARYLQIAESIEDLPFASTSITPDNYKFRYLGEIGKETAAAHRFQITPKKKREGLIQGELWIDAASGTEVLHTGRLVKLHSTSGEQVHIVRDTRILNGHPLFRVTHVSIDTARLGRGELRITELPADSVQIEIPGLKMPTALEPSPH